MGTSGFEAPKSHPLPQPTGKTRNAVNVRGAEILAEQSMNEFVEPLGMRVLIWRGMGVAIRSPSPAARPAAPRPDGSR
jgi:hypothetical protein